MRRYTSQLEIKRSKKEVFVAETALRMLNEAMSNYIFVVMTDFAYAEGVFGTVEFYDIEFSDAERIRAAALASDSDGIIDNYFRFANGRIVSDANVETGPNGNGYQIKKLRTIAGTCSEQRQVGMICRVRQRAFFLT